MTLRYICLTLFAIGEITCMHTSDTSQTRTRHTRVPDETISELQEKSHHLSNKLYKLGDINNSRELWNIAQDLSSIGTIEDIQRIQDKLHCVQYDIINKNSKQSDKNSTQG